MYHKQIGTKFKKKRDIEAGKILRYFVIAAIYFISYFIAETEKKSSKY